MLVMIRRIPVGALGQGEGEGHSDSYQILIDSLTVDMRFLKVEDNLIKLSSKSPSHQMQKSKILMLNS